MSSLLDLPLREVVAKYPHPIVMKGVIAKYELEKREREKLKARARDSLIDFAQYVDPLYIVDKMHKLIASVLEKVVSNEIKRLLITAPPQTGKPLDIDTFILMADGSRKRLGDIVIGDHIITHKNRSRKVIAVHDQGFLPTLKIKTDVGIEINSAYEHSFLTTDGWKQANELKPGDFLAKIFGVGEDKDNNQIPIEAFRLAGYFIGDGSVTKNSTTFHATITSFDDLIVKDINYCAEVMGFSVKQYKKGGYGLSGGVIDWLKEIGIAGQNSHTKRVPKFVYEGSKKQISNFLGAYFACDGTVTRKGLDRHGNERSDKQIEFYSVCKDLLSDCQHLLLRFGINTRLRLKNGKLYGKDHKSWRLYTNKRNDVSIFSDNIFIVGKKAELLSKWRQTKTDFDYDFIAEQIDSIETCGSKFCKCLTVDEDETFTANDIVVHNSRLVSEIFPAYWFGKRPNDSIILSSYADTLACDKGLKARDIITCQEYQEMFPEIKIRDDKQARNDWEISSPHHGEFYSAGVGSGITGRGALLGLIDDPVKDWEDGQSKTIKEKTWDWYESTFRTRIRDGGAIILIMTRWAKDDLFGRILLGGKEKWLVLRLPALCETQEERDKNDKALGFSIGNEDPLKREVGESVAPHRFSAQTLQANIDGISSTKSSAIYKGVPRSPEGDKVKRHWFDIADRNEVPFKAKRARYWDPAGSKKKTSKYTAGIRGCIDGGIFYIEDVQRDRMTPAERNRLMRQTAELDDNEYGTFQVKQWWEEEGGSSGLDSSDNYATEVFKGYSAEKDRPTGSKDVRLDPFIGWAEQKRVKLVRGRWNEEWLDEMCSLTGIGDEVRDQADATAGLFNRLQKGNVVNKPSTSYDDMSEREVLGSIGLKTW